MFFLTVTVEVDCELCFGPLEPAVVEGAISVLILSATVVVVTFPSTAVEAVAVLDRSSSDVGVAPTELTVEVAPPASDTDVVGVTAPDMVAVSTATVGLVTSGALSVEVVAVLDPIFFDVVVAPTEPAVEDALSARVTVLGLTAPVMVAVSTAGIGLVSCPEPNVEDASVAIVRVFCLTAFVVVITSFAFIVVDAPFSSTTVVVAGRASVVEVVSPPYKVEVVIFVASVVDLTFLR